MGEIQNLIGGLAKAGGAPGIVLALTLVASVVWLARQYLKLRIELNDLKRGSSQQVRDAVVDAWNKVRELEGHGLSAEDFECAKNQILSTVETGSTSIAPREDVGSTETDNTEDAPKGRFEAFVGGLFQFGFLGFWSVGWGFGVGTIAVPAFNDLWNWTYQALVDGVVTDVFLRSLLLIPAAAIAAGLWIVPTIGAFYGAIVGLLRMIGAVLPASFTYSVRSKAESLQSKNPLSW